MLLACSIENTNIFLGVFDGETLVFHSRITTNRNKSDDEYAILIRSLFAMNSVALTQVSGAIIASVVRPLNAPLSQAIQKLTRIKPMLLGPGVKTGLNIQTDIPSQVGADIVANAVAAISLESCPLVVIDFGTATTLTGINENGDLSGVLIHPGVRSALDALSSSAAELPSVALDSPKHLLGKNTNDSMVGGTIYGNAAMIDGLLDRIAREWHTDELTVVATGDYAELILHHCQGGHRIRYVPHLALIGLRRIYSLNTRPRSGQTERS